MLLPSDSELVDAAALTYKSTASPLAQDFDRSVVAYLTAQPDSMNVLAIEGTHDVLGWALDFLALPISAHAPKQHPTLGMLHAGFLAAAEALLPRIAVAVVGKPWVITGHSLGAALALLVGALMADEDNPPLKIAAFAPPRVGGPHFLEALAAIPISAYRFGNDPVTEVPFTVVPQFDYRQVPLIQIGEPMAPSWKCHAIENYVGAVKALPAC